MADAPAEPGLIQLVAKQGCGGRMAWSRHGQVYSPWLSVRQIRRDREQQTPVGGGGGDVYCLLEPRLPSLARQPLALQGLHWRFAPVKDWPRCLIGVSLGGWGLC